MYVYIFIHIYILYHCLAFFDLRSFGLGGLPATMLLGCWPLRCPFGTLRAQGSHLVRGVFQLPCSLKLSFFFVVAASCTLNPGCQDLLLFCRFFLFVLFWVLLSRFLHGRRSLLGFCLSCPSVQASVWVAACCSESFPAWPSVFPGLWLELSCPSVQASAWVVRVRRDLSIRSVYSVQ